MFIVHATKKVLDRLRAKPSSLPHESTTVLGPWYATAWFWKPQIALFVYELMLLPVLIPLAPAATVVDGFRDGLRVTLGAHGVDSSFIADEIAQMTEHQVAKTANRSAVGIMNEFTLLAGHAPPPADAAGLVELSLGLAHTPCSPLYKRHVSPDDELRAFVDEHLSRPTT